MDVADFASVVSSIATLLVSVGALVVFIGVFVLVVRLGRALEIMSEQLYGGRRDSGSSPGQ